MGAEVRAAFERALEALYALSRGECQVAADGTRLIGSTRHTSNDRRLFHAPLHFVYPPLDEHQIGEMSGLLGFDVPEDLAVFYQCANGCALFAISLTISGLVIRRSRALDSYSPISIEYGNLVETPAPPTTREGVPRNHIRFGGYSYGDGYELSMPLDGSGRVFVTPRYVSEPIIAEWPSLADFLRDEVVRMSALAAAPGIVLDSLHVLPPPNVLVGRTN